MSAGTSESLLEELKPKEALALLREELARPQPSAQPDELAGPSAPGASVAATFMAFAGQTPWWVCSVLLHVLAIFFLSLMVKAVEFPPEKKIVVVTSALRTPFDEPPRPMIKPAERTVSEKSVPVKPAAAPAAVKQPDAVIPPHIEEQAEIGDHFETINPDRPDTHSAFGNPDAHLFYSVHGVNDASGGGGAGGEVLRDALGLGKSAGAGTGGGWGGGHGTGVGADRGRGRGSYGQRDGGGRKLMIKRYGGSAATEASVAGALRWLAEHQARDGHWNCAAYSGADQDIAATAFALLAFTGAGESEQYGEYQDTVRRAVVWLRNNQRSVGAVGVDGYEIAIATLALSEAAGMANVPETRVAAQRAVDYCSNVHQSRMSYGRWGWRYRLRELPCDLSVTGWFVMALTSAKAAGLTVDPASLDGASRFLDSVDLGKNGGRVPGYGYTSADETTPRLTAIGCLCRSFLGAKREDLNRSVQWLVRQGRTPGETGETDLYYWYYGGYCAFQQGGEIWQKWNESMKACLTRSQCKSGDDAGSWEPKGIYSTQWGRVGQTALSAMCLEVYYRHLGGAVEQNP